MRDDAEQSLDHQLPDMVKTSLAIVAVRRLVQAMNANAAELARETGLGPLQFLTLQAVGAGGHDTVDDLVRVVRLSKGATSKLVRELEDGGFLERRHNDRTPRRTYLILTERGRGVMRQAPQLLQTVFLRNFADLPGWEQAMIVAALDRAAQLMTVERTKKAPKAKGGVHARESARTRHH